MKKLFNQLKTICDLPLFDGNLERFCAIGDENGLFICINNKIKDWFPTNDTAFPSEFEVLIVEKEKKHRVVYKDETIQLLKTT